MPNLSTLFLQIAVVICTARIVGFLFRRFLHQPQVIGEMFAGIILGPSLLGWVAPGAFATLFPPESLGFLNALSQFGLVLFMFLVGLELDLGATGEHPRSTVIRSHIGIATSFLLGTLLALFLYPRLSDGSVRFFHFALFMGTAMSITAFPVLARILTERKLIRTKLGTLAVTCAAVDDVTGWCILAGIVLLVRATTAATPLWFTVLGSLAYFLIMVFFVRPMLRKLLTLYQRRGTVSKDNLAMVVVLVLASGWATEHLGIHALFGAFLMGSIMPRDVGFVRDLSEKLHDAAVVLLLPLFFAFVGLRTSLGLVRGTEMWLYLGLIVLTAVVGKLGGAALAARMFGLPWRTATSLGILMNTRGLMELVVLNIGLELGVLSPTLFTMMVLMALVTTFMTAPLLEWVHFRQFLPSENAVSIPSPEEPPVRERDPRPAEMA